MSHIISMSLSIIKNCKTIVTLHDILFIDFPNIFLSHIVF